MSSMERPPTGNFGFARRSPGEAALPSADVAADGHLGPDRGPGGVYTKPEQMPASEQANTDRPAEREAWIVRPKLQQPSQDSASPIVPEPRRRPGFAHHNAGSLAYAVDHQSSSKRWLALGLAGMVYVTGIVGLWSMVQTFDGTAAAPSFLPADGDKGLPPLDRQIDLQDAFLDGPFIPQFRPKIRPGDSEDVANSGLQKTSDPG